MRRPYIDWMRGVAVVIMIMAHTLDSWTVPADRSSTLYIWQVRLAGMGAPLFLFLAGVAVALSASAQVRRGASPAAAAAAVRWRGWEIFALAFLFRLQSWLLSPGATVAGLLKVDVLNIMGPAIAGAAAVWRGSTRPAMRVVLLASVASAFALLTPLVRQTPWLAPLPDPIEWYLRPPPGRSWFALFPWAGLLFAGAAVGVVVDLARGAAAERRAVAWLGATGVVVCLAAWAGTLLPPLYAPTYFWTTSASYFFLRIGLMTGLVAVTWLWLQRPMASRWSPMIVFGKSSLFVYWVHVEIVYGVLTHPLHRALPLPWAMVAFVSFTGLMLWLAIVKQRLAARWRAERAAFNQPAGASS